jgi:hypothetical protein
MLAGFGASSQRLHSFGKLLQVVDPLLEERGGGEPFVSASSQEQPELLLERAGYPSKIPEHHAEIIVGHCFLPRDGGVSARLARAAARAANERRSCIAISSASRP